MGQATKLGVKERAAEMRRQLAMRPKFAEPQQPIKASPAIDRVFRDATIYDSTESRWIVRSMTESEDGEL